MAFSPTKHRSCFKQRQLVVEEICVFLDIKNIEAIVFQALAVAFVSPSWLCVCNKCQHFICLRAPVGWNCRKAHEITNSRSTEFELGILSPWFILCLYLIIVCPYDHSYPPSSWQNLLSEERSLHSNHAHMKYVAYLCKQLLRFCKIWGPPLD